MDCSKVELWLSEYMEDSLPEDRADLVAMHLRDCINCTTLLEAMRANSLLCSNYPSFEMSPVLIDRILKHTSGLPRSQSFKEALSRYFFHPLLVPKFAIGIVLTALSLTLTINTVLPKFSLAISSMSPAGIVRLMDRGAQRLYGEGLKAYDKKTEFLDQLVRLKNNTFNSLRSMIEQFEVPLEGHKKKQQPGSPADKESGEQSSSLLLWPT